MCATVSTVVLPRQFLSGLEAWVNQMETTLDRTVQCADQGMGQLAQVRRARSKSIYLSRVRQ